MANGGFVVKFDGKLVKRCYSVSFDHDRWEWTFNLNDTQPLPDKLKTITVEIEVLPEGER